MPMEEEKWRRRAAFSPHSGPASSLYASSYSSSSSSSPHHHPAFASRFHHLRNQHTHAHAHSPAAGGGVGVAGGAGGAGGALPPYFPRYYRRRGSSGSSTSNSAASSPGLGGLAGTGGLDSSASGLSSSSSSSSSSLQFLPNKSAYVGVFRHAPCTRGFKDLFWEPAFSLTCGRAALTQMDLARQERFKTRHVETEELEQLPSIVYKDLMRKRRREKRRAMVRMMMGLGQELEGGEEEEGFERVSVDVMDMTTGGAATESFFDFEEDEDEEYEEGEEDGEGAGEAGGRHICVICLDGFTPWDDVRELPACKHVHHRRCIDLWLRGSCSYEACYTRSCPTCKTPLSFSFPPASVVAEMGGKEGMDAGHEEGKDDSYTGTATTTNSSITSSSPRSAPTPSLMSHIFEIPRWAYTRVGNSLMQQTTTNDDNESASTTTTTTPSSSFPSSSTSSS